MDILVELFYFPRLRRRPPVRLHHSVYAERIVGGKVSEVSAESEIFVFSRLLFEVGEVYFRELARAVGEREEKVFFKRGFYNPELLYCPCEAFVAFLVVFGYGERGGG